MPTSPPRHGPRPDSTRRAAPARVRRWATGGAVALALESAGHLLVAALPQACAESPPGAARRVTLTSVVRARSLEPFTNGAGWKIGVTRALFSIGPLYYFEGAPVAARGAPWWHDLGVRVAHAHPGHYAQGEVLGESLTERVVDLVAGPVELGTGKGVTGLARSARLTFSEVPAGALAPALRGGVVRLEGTAERDAATIEFGATVLAADLVDESGAPAVAGCPLAGGDLRGDGTITLSIELDEALDQLDLSELPAGSPAELAPSSRAHQALVRGLRKAATYSFAFEP